MAESDDSREQRLDAVIAKYYLAVERGEAPDQAVFLAEHAEFAEQLKEFFAAISRLDEAVGPVNLEQTTTRVLNLATSLLNCGAGVRYFGDYEILEIIGMGGMGVVYKARQSTLKRIVALKMIRDGELATPHDVRRFEAEARAAARLSHPNIVSVHEVGVFEGRHFFTMDYVGGGSLSQLHRGQPVASRRAAEMVLSLAEAVEYAHQRGIIHRDLKPANILLAEDGSLQITDFGLAKQLWEGSGSQSAALTETGQILGTAGYMSPEQASGRRQPFGPASDVYSIGAILYELLTGAAPFRGGAPMEILRRVCEQDPVPPRQLNPTVPRGLESICLRCLQKDPSHRYATAGELASDLRRFRTGQPVHARTMGPLRRVFRWSLYWSFRNRLVVSLSLTILLLGCVVIGLIPGNNSPKADTTLADTRHAEAIIPDRSRAAAAYEPPEGGDAAATQPPQSQNAADGPPDAAVTGRPDAAALVNVPAAVVEPPPSVPPEFDDPLHALRALRVAESPRATVTGSAIAGAPFGVAGVLIKFDPAALPTLKPDDPVWMTEKSQRVLYPAVTMDVDDQHRVRSVRIRFLFQGEADLHLTATAVGSYPLTIAPVQHGDGTAQRNLWWKAYSRSAQGLAEQLAGHDMLRNYLQMMLARRLGLALPENPQSVTNLLGADLAMERYLHLLLGTASLRVALQKEVLLNVANPQEHATLALPRSVMPPPVSIPAFPPSPLEPLSEHIPEECFYVRCRTFADWQWFRGALSAWGGNLNQLVVQRGLDQGIQRRLEKQIALSEDTAAELFADDAIAEFALIGSDTFYLEGAAFGIVVRARDGIALQAVIERQRRSAALATPQARETKEEIAGHSVSFLSTADNSVRSFYAVDGDAHCVTTSRRLVERFFEAGLGRRSLAKLQAFQYARHKFPLIRDDAVFVYLSDPFFANILSAPYRIEMTRRARALADLELVQMARWAAIAERGPFATVTDLVSSGLLPESIRRRADESEALLKGGVPVDSLRGAAGTFLPIPDTSITGATPGEHAAYEQFADAYARLWARMDPVIIALNRRTTPQSNREQILCDVNVMPLAAGMYGAMAEVFLKTTKESIKPPEGSLLHASVALNHHASFYEKNEAPVLIFAGMGDLPPTLIVSLRSGTLQTEFTPDSGSLKRIILSFPLLYRGLSSGTKTLEDPSLRDFSLHPGDQAIRDEIDRILPRIRESATRIDAANRLDALDKLTPRLEAIADRPAQIRLTLADLNGTRWGTLARTVLYWQARHLSAANPLLLHELTQQLHLEHQEARPLAEELLRGRLVCPLGGEYVTITAPGRPARWVSTAWPQAAVTDVTDVNDIPSHYVAPFLGWFHGLSVETTISSDTLTVHFEVAVNTDATTVTETQAQTEVQARAALAQVLVVPTAGGREAMFHEWVNRFQGTSLLEKVRVLLPDLWKQREDAARKRLSGLHEPAAEAELLRLMKEFPLTTIVPEIDAKLRERKAVEEWARGAPTRLTAQDREDFIDEICAKHFGTELQKGLDEMEAFRSLQELRDSGQKWIIRAMDELESPKDANRAASLRFLVAVEFHETADVSQLTRLMLTNPRPECRRNAAIIINRLGEPAWDQAAGALHAALQDPIDIRCLEGQQVLRVTATSWIKPSAQPHNASRLPTNSSRAMKPTEAPVTLPVMNRTQSPQPVILESKQAGDTRDDNGLKQKLVWCPPGTFQMGYPPDERDRLHNEAQVSVTLTRGFWLGQTEVTQGQVRQVLKIKPWEGEMYVKEGPDYPASYVSWDEATEFCVKLTQTERTAGRLAGNEQYRLPTYAEWEYACRAGTTTAYGFGADAGSLGEYAWYDKNTLEIGQNYAHAVGSKKPNAWGLHDMHGNVWEWCDSNSSRARAYCGGGWYLTPGGCRSSDRLENSPGSRSYDLGFRIARSQASR